MHPLDTIIANKTTDGWQPDNRPLTIAEQLLVYTYLKNKFGL